MKIKRLTVAGFGPFKNEQSVDFGRFDNDGIFLISGKTGAGKSSILDAICYALYNGVPRYEGTQQRLRSDYCDLGDPTFVELEFSVNGTDYKVRRSPEFDRPKKRNAAETTRQAATAELFVRSPSGGALGADGADGAGAQWEGIAARLVDVAHELDRVVGLSKDQFLQVILLAQNRFQEFLRSNNDQRQAVLRTLFGTKRFEQIELGLAARRKALECELNEARSTMAHQVHLAANVLQLEGVPDAADLGWFESSLVGLDERAEAAGDASRSADAAAAVADGVYRNLDIARRQQERRDTAAGKLAMLAGSHDAINADRMTLHAAHRANSVWSHVVARREAHASLVGATGAQAAAAAELVRELPELAQTVTDAARSTPSGDANSNANINTNPAAALTSALAVAIDETTRLLGTLKSVLVAERLLPGLEREIEDSERSFRDSDTAVGLARESIDRIPARIDASAELILSAQVAASTKAEAAERVERTTSARRGALAVLELEPQHTTALAAERDANGALSAAATSLTHLIDERINGHASELASALVPGAPCAVCGSVEHPAPAAWDGELVTEQAIARARSAVDRCQGAATAARSIAQDIATRIARAMVQSAEQSVDTLTSSLAAARVQLAKATAAEAEVTLLGTQQASLRAELAAAKAGLDDLQTVKGRAADALADQKARYATIAAQSADHRAKDASVTARVERLQRRLASAHALSAANAEMGSRRRALDSAHAALGLQMRDNDFINEDAVVVARRPAVQIDTLAARIRDHDQAVNTAMATLEEPELVGLPDEIIDLTAAVDAVGSARAARDAAYSERGAVVERALQLRKVVVTAREHHATSARLLERFDKMRELSAAVEGSPPNLKRMRLETYVLAAELEEIVEAANTRLRVMTSGRFALEHDDGLQYHNARSGLGLAIRDEHTGRARATHSLSGGETFLASLALALGLAEVVTNRAGGITLDTLFIDEGFGSLDSDTLDIALSTLDGLRAGGRTIGLISHVDTMKEQIPAKLLVTVTDRGDSEIAHGGIGEIFS